MVRMGDIWDRTTQVLGGRVGMIAPIALVALLLPTILRDAYMAYAAASTTGYVVIGGLLSLLAIVATIWGQLAIIAIATDPATTRGEAQALAGARLLPAIGIALLVGFVFGILTLPPVIALSTSGVQLWPAATGSAKIALAPGTLAFVSLYSLALLIVSLWIGARLALLNAVVVNERLGIGAIRRSIALTRGLTWRIIGVILLFAVVLLVAVSAARLAIGLGFRLILGTDGIVTATLLGSVAAAIVATGFTVIAAVFAAQLYVATRTEEAMAPR